MLKGLKDRMLNISSSAKRIILISAVSCLAICAICTAFLCRKEITVADGENPPIQFVTYKRYVEDALKAQNIALGEGDKLNCELDDKLTDSMKIEIYRAFTVTVTEKGERKEYKTTKHTVGEALAELGLGAKESDITTPGYYDEISAFADITLIRTSEEVVAVCEEIPYESREKINTSLASGEKKLVQEGKPGEKKVSYRISYEDGVEVSRETLSEEIVSQPVDQIKEVGPRKKIDYYQIASAGTIQTSRSGSLSYSKVITANASAYDASSCGKSPSSPGYGITATGRRATHGVVAVDPSVIPLGTRMYIEGYGSAVAADTGSAIRGNRIDLCFNSRAEALSFGRRNVKVYILN